MLRRVYSILHLIVAISVPLTLQHGDHAKHAHIPKDGPDNKFHDERMIRDKDHIQEHLKEEIGFNGTEEISDADADFYYFKMHDLNNDTMLDGLEILSALTHMLPYEELYAKSGGEEEEESKKQFKTPEELKAAAEKKHDEAMDYYTNIIDKVLKDDDQNDDGMMSYMEYMRARRREEAANPAETAKTEEAVITK